MKESDVMGVIEGAAEPAPQGRLNRGRPFPMNASCLME